VALITGGASLLGSVIAGTLAELGASVVLASRNLQRCEEAARQLRDAGMKAFGEYVDVTKPDRVKELVTRVNEHIGPIDILVCNAGGSITRTYLPTADIAEFEATLALNLTSVFACVQAVAPPMIAARNGAIITIGSVHGTQTVDKRLYHGIEKFRRSGPQYQAAKGGVINLTRAFAAELAEFNIRVNCISPGFIPGDTVDPKLNARMASRTPLGRTGSPGDLRGAVTLLASGAGEWITGQNIVVDGGWSIW
jgi:NAD(P)-dependent dehydrogenase (short-subunit alcohol dehydrogenase family)